MKAFLASLALLSAATSGAQGYLDPNITRTYYLGELEHCPGKLDMQPGDLWTLTFPETVTDAFVTRNGIVERQIQGNRLVMAVTSPTGSTPALVLTEDGRAPRFNIMVEAGKGGRNKNVLIKPGLPPSGSRCKAATLAPAPTPPKPAVTKPTTTPPVVKPNPDPRTTAPVTVRPPVTVTPRSGTPIAIRPTTPPAPPTVTATIPVPSTPAALSPTRPAPVAANPKAVVAGVTYQVPPASKPAVASPALPSPPLPARPMSARPPVTVNAQAPAFLTVRVTTHPDTRGTLTFTFNNTLDADLVLNEAELRMAGAAGKNDTDLIIPAGGEVTRQVALTGPLPALIGQLTWPGVILGSGEPFQVRAMLVL